MNNLVYSGNYMPTSYYAPDNFFYIMIKIPDFFSYFVLERLQFFGHVTDKSFVHLGITSSQILANFTATFPPPINW